MRPPRGWQHDNNTHTLYSSIGVEQVPDAGECCSVGVYDAVGLHVLVLGQVVERVDTALGVTVVNCTTLRQLLRAT